MRFRRLLILLAVVSTLSSASWAEQRYAKLTILHTNDTHSHLLPFSYPSVVMSGGAKVDVPFHENVGGIARRATIIKQMNAKNDAVLVMDAGDVLDGSPFSIEFAGEADFAAMNAAGYEVMVTGNHEFSNTSVDFRKRLQEARFPILGANVVTQDGKPFLTPYIVRLEAGLRVGVLGLTVSNDYNTAREEKLAFNSSVKVARELVPKLRNEADVVILLTHLGHDVDKWVATQVPGIDAIIGGHSHTRVPKPVLVKSSLPPRAFWVGGTVVAQDFQWGSELGEVDLTFHKDDSGWSLMSFDGKLIPVTGEIPEDPAVRAVVEKYHKKIAAKYDVVIGKATADFIGEAPYNLVSDALREHFSADFAIHNYGGVRTDLVKGKITIGDIATLLPFSNSLLTFTVSGKQLKEILGKGHPAVSNIKYRIQAGKLVFAELGAQPIEDEKMYTGVTHSFFALHEIPQEVSLTDTGTTTRDVVTAYIKGKKSVSPDDEQRAVGH